MVEKLYKDIISLKYVTLRENISLILLVPFLMEWFGFFVLLPKFIDKIEIHDIFFFFLINMWFLYCRSFKHIQKLFIKKGKRYSGKIIKAEMTSGYGQATYYLFIEFYKGNKRLIRRTNGYMGSPNAYLKNNKCSIYEYIGRFIEADFNIRDKLPDYGSYEYHTKIEKHRLFMPKGNKYV